MTTLYEVYSIDEVTGLMPVWFRSDSQQEVKDWILQRESQTPHNFYWRKKVGKK